MYSPENWAILDTIEDKELADKTWFAGCDGNKVFFGKKDLVGDVLGWEHPVARDASRKLRFTYGYVGSAGNNLPNLAELKSMESQLKNDLSRLGDECMRRRAPITNPDAISLPKFSIPQSLTNAWDELISKITHSKTPCMGVMDASGKVSFMDFHATPAVADASTAAAKISHHADDAVAAIQKPDAALGSRGGCKSVVAVFAGIGLLTAFIIGMTSKGFTRAKDKIEKPSDRLR